MKLVLTCEHASNRIPKRFEKLFTAHKTVLNTHRGFDLGAYDLFKFLKTYADFSQHQRVSRLLVETNRSIGHPVLFSEFSKLLTSQEKESILKRYYYPYLESVTQVIAELIEEGEDVLHLSIHSFTPVLNEEKRHGDIGLLYDPSRISEKNFAIKFRNEFYHNFPSYHVRFNYPYLGKADGFPTSLRKKFPKHYLGIELEVNQKFSKNNKMDVHLKKSIKEILLKILE
ncbi:N-formylglutamate amidohydrolase [Gramella sp. AN32]|uniref:N-formylglutamate amidohydrolase n=1 Tax=Christiangramia antarctica TaxID=2058158 RepID=A0ABW5XA37_9FLAO|nr:N-formylglutamate amidohydrolase [Gramella sp. AN32]